MIKELVEFGKRIRIGHDALKDEPISIDLVINEDGSFNSFSVIEKIIRRAEALNSKKGKARLLLDKAEEVLNYSGYDKAIQEADKTDEQQKAASTLFKHNLYLAKLQAYMNLDCLAPVFLFFNENKLNGIDKAANEFEIQVGEKERAGNIAFRFNDIRIHEQKEVYDAIIERFEKEQANQIKGSKKLCSVCGKSDFPD